MKRPDPFISIIIPSYNRAAFLEKTIPGLLNLDYQAYEIIIVDDGSTDNTQPIFDKIKAPNLSYYKKQNEERAAARNYGAAFAKGDYITFLDSDDQIYTKALRYTADALQAKAYTPFFHMAYDIGTEDDVSKSVTDIQDNDPLLLIKGNPLSCIGVFIKKEAFEKHKFNPDRALSGSEDWELWLRLAAHYGLRTDNKVIGRLVQHDTRSVIHVSEKRLLERKTLAIKYAFEDAAVQKVYGPYKHSILAYWLTYVSLHLAMDGNKKRGFYHFMRAVKYDLRSVFTKRGLVILKLLLLKKNFD